MAASPELPELSTDALLVIVTGAHLLAERRDRPIAYRLRERILEWIDAHTGGDADNADGESVIVEPLEPVVCTDLWYMNNEELMQRPTLSVGAPGVNALTAFLANRLPTAFAIDDTLQVMMDVELSTLRACMWGRDASATASAVDAFIQRYLDRFLRRAHGG